MQNLICVLIGTSTTGLHSEKEKEIKLVNRIKKTKAEHYILLNSNSYFDFLLTCQIGSNLHLSLTYINRSRFLKRKLQTLLVCELHILIVALLMFQQFWSGWQSGWQRLWLAVSLVETSAQSEPTHNFFVGRVQSMLTASLYIFDIFHTLEIFS